MINKREIRYLLLASTVTLGVIGCGDIIDKVEDRPAPPANRGQYLDSNVSGLHYKATFGKCHYVEDENSSTSKEVCEKTIEGTTYNGIFGFIPGGNGVKLSVAGLTLDYIPQKYLLRNSVLTVRETDGKIASFLQSMDSDGNASNGINISREVVKALRDLNVSKYNYIANSDLNIETLVQQVQEKLDANAPKETPSNDSNQTDNNETRPNNRPTITLKFVPEDKALDHLKSTISAHTTPPSITVEKVIDDVKDILDNAKTYSEDEIQDKVKALRTTLNNPLEGDRGLTDIEIAKTLLDLSELTNEGYLEDVLDFKGSVDSHLSQIIKEMALDKHTPDEERIVRTKDENSTNVVVDTKKAISSIVRKLQIISNRLGVSLASAPQYYRFKYDGLDISLDNIQALRSVLLATASKLSLILAYNIGKDSDYIPKIYTDKQGYKYEYEDMSIHTDKLFNRDGFGVATNQSALTNAKKYLLQSAMILKDLDANLVREDLNETLTNTSQETSDNQEIIDYAKKLYKALYDNNGTFTITDKHGGDNGEKEEYEIAINRLFDTKTAVSLSDFGTDWKYSCDNGYKMTTEAESKFYDEVRCYRLKDDYSADLEPTTKPESETSKLDELITKITIGDSVVKTGQELIDYIVDIDSNKGDSNPSTPPPSQTTPTHSRDKLLVKETKYKDDGTVDTTTTFKYNNRNMITSWKMVGSYTETCTDSYNSQNRPTIIDCVEGDNTKNRTEYFYSENRLSKVDYYQDGNLSMRESVIEWNGDKPKKIKRTTYTENRLGDETMTLTFTGKNPTRIDGVNNKINYTYTTLKKYDTKKTPYDTVSDFGFYWWFGVNNVTEEKMTYNYDGQTRTSETLTKNSITYNSSDLPTRIDTTITTDGNKEYQQRYYTIYEYKDAIK